MSGAAATKSIPALARGTPARPDALRRHLPNSLTVLRLLIAVWFFVLLTFWKGPRPAALGDTPIDRTLLLAGVLFIIAAITDAVDGYLSRRWRTTSVFGRVMDPFADKILVVGAFIYLASPLFLGRDAAGNTVSLSGIHPWMVVLIVARELLVTSIRGLVESQGISFAASAAGKAKMIVQSSSVPTIVLAIALLDVSPGTFGRGLITASAWITVAVTVVSGWPYAVRGWRMLADSLPDSPDHQGPRS